MFRIIEERLLKAPKWRKTDIVLKDAPNDPQVLYFCDIDECALSLASNPAFQGKIDYELKAIFTWNKTGLQYIQIFNEMSMGNIWMQKQVQYDDYYTPNGFLPACLSRKRPQKVRHYSL